MDWADIQLRHNLKLGKYCSYTLFRPIISTMIALKRKQTTEASSTEVGANRVGAHFKVVTLSK